MSIRDRLGLSAAVAPGARVVVQEGCVSCLLAWWVLVRISQPGPQVHIGMLALASQRQ